MASYRGPAVVHTPDGRTIEVDADVVAPDVPTPEDLWFGTLQGDIDGFDLLDGPSTIELPSGARSTFLPARSDLVLMRQGVEIKGTEPLAL